LRLPGPPRRQRRPGAATRTAAPGLRCGQPRRGERVGSPDRWGVRPVLGGVSAPGGRSRSTCWRPAPGWPASASGRLARRAPLRLAVWAGAVG